MGIWLQPNMLVLAHALGDWYVSVETVPSLGVTCKHNYPKFSRLLESVLL